MDNIVILNALKEYKNFATLTDFARFIGIKPQALSNWYARNTLDLHILSEAFPEVDGNWLLTGEGSMLKTNHQSISNIDNSNVVGANVNGTGININSNQSELLAIIRKQQEQMDKLIDAIAKIHQ